MIDFFRIIEHLLPHSIAFKLTIEKKLKSFVNGLSSLPANIKNYADLIFLDIFPENTRQVKEWENQFGFVNNGLTEQQRRDRLNAYWKDSGGQSPKYIQDTLRANGFDVYVHEWWNYTPDVNIKQCVIPKSPFKYIKYEYTGVILNVECGELEAQCGEAFAQSGNSENPKGYPLVNKVYKTYIDYNTGCGEQIMLCGEEIAECGNYTGFKEYFNQYFVTNDTTKWPYFLYIGGESIGDVATIPETRKNEFEELCLKICPSQQWLGIITQYN